MQFIEVAIVQRRLTHYRVPLFQAMRDRLARSNVRLRLLTGTGDRKELMKGDEGSLDWAEPLQTRYLGGERVCWQPYGKKLKNCSLVVVPQENSLVYNQRMLWLPRQPKLAFWGHGANLQSARPQGLCERFKRVTLRRADWWFAYTSHTAEILRSTGYPQERVTVLNNTVDLQPLIEAKRAIDDRQIDDFRIRHGMKDGAIGVFIGSLYENKNLDFLLEASARIRTKVPNFYLLIAGDGPLRSKIEQARKEKQWIRWIGNAYGKNKALAIRSSDLMLLPSAVGLAILDSFACGVPMICTASSGHGPEIAYLENGSNGLMTEPDVDLYADAIINLLQERTHLNLLRDGATKSARFYSLEAMVERFCSGILEALSAPRRRP
jgi:glycosyltransferase involved in cell wall biosynthesis